MVFLRQNDCTDYPTQPNRNLDQHQDEDEGSLAVIIFDLLRLDRQSGDEGDQEEDIEEAENVIGGAEVTTLL